MTEDNFNNLEEEEFDLISKCLEAYEQGNLNQLRFSEEQFELILDHFIEGGYDELVLEIATMAYHQHPYSITIIIRYVDVLIVNDELELAQSIIEAKLANDPINADLHFLLSRLSLKKDNIEPYMPHFNKALSFASEEAKLEMYLTISQDLIDDARYQEALKLLLVAEQLFPKKPELLNDIAFCYERRGVFDKSIIYYQKYLDIDPFNDNVWYNVGTIYARELMEDKAIEAFDYAIALNQNNSSAMFNKGLLLINNMRLDEGIEIFTEFLKSEPDSIPALLMVTEVYIAKNMYSQAQKTAIKVLELDEENLFANSNLAYLNLVSRQFFSSLDYLKKIIGNPDTNYDLLSEHLKVAFYSTIDPEFLAYYLVSLYFMNEPTLFHTYLKELNMYDEKQKWLKKIIKLVPHMADGEFLPINFGKPAKRNKRSE